MRTLWIGGPPGSGKSTVAQLIARRRGLRWYNGDAHTWEHRDRAIVAGNAAAIRFEELSPEQRWSRPPAELLAMSLHHERGAMFAADLAALPDTPATIAEGTAITPKVAGVGVWLVPTLEVQRARLAERRLSAGTATLYELLVGEIEREVVASGALYVVVDGKKSIAETVTEVEQLLGSALQSAPTATDVAGRRALARYSNRAIVIQHLSYFARPWTSGDPGDTVRSFWCECGRSECLSEVDLAIGDFPAERDDLVLAPGH